MGVFVLAVFLLLYSLSTLFKVEVSDLALGLTALIAAILLLVDGLGASPWWPKR